MENVRCLELSIDDTVSHKFFHHLFLSRVTITLSYEIGVVDFGMRLTFRIVFTSVTLCFGHVWGTVISNKVSILSKESMEEWPTTITTFIHVVTCHELLW